MKVADFFCGAGGFSEGFRQKGFNVVFALDNWKPAIETHHLNHPESNSVLMNILELDTPEKIDKIVPDTEVIVGSPPCISFSNSNRSGNADKTLGLELIKSFLRIVAWKKKKGILKYWIMENVPNSLKYTKDKYSWKELGLKGKGPDLEIPKKVILNSADFGAPQIRKRFFAGDFPLPKETNEKKNYRKIKEIFESLGNPSNGKSKKIIKDPLYGFSLKKSELTDHFYDNRIEEFEWKKARNLKRDHGYMGRMSFPEEINRPSRTIMATMSASTRESIIFLSFDSKNKKNGYRLPTIREAACFMSFPIDYQFEASGEGSKYRLVGNAVCPKLSGALAETILEKENKRVKKNVGMRKIIFPKNNLNGVERKKKSFKKKKYESRFFDHIPHLKIRNYRVSLENVDSNFEKKKIIWKCVLHHGTGKQASKLEVSERMARKLVENMPNFKKFESGLNKLFNKFKYNKNSLHESFLENPFDGGPREILIKIKDIIDTIYSNERFDNIELKHREKGFNIGNGTMPLKIGLALYGCSLFASKMN